MDNTTFEPELNIVTFKYGGGESSRVPLGIREEESLPCLYSNNSTETNIKSTTYRKSANALSWNVQYFSERFGIDNIGFLTLTFKDHIICYKKAQKRLNSLLSHIIKPRYSDYVGVMERQKSGRIHYHFLVNCQKNIRDGINFVEIQNRVYKSANQNLRDEWAFWRKTAPKYRFGRTELIPVKSNSEAIGRYIGKYIGKHIEQRHVDDKGARLVRYSQSARTCTTRFMFLTDGSKAWRAKVKAFVYMISDKHDLPPTFESLKQVLGPRWAHNNRDYILSLPILS